MRREKLPRKKTSNSDIYKDIMSPTKSIDIESGQVVSRKKDAPKSDVVELLEEIRDLLKELLSRSA